MMEMEVRIPDSIRPYLNEIAERLWAKRAAVMVGAGFSKNAGGVFPDWNQLGDLFHQKAHGKTPDPSNQKYLNALRLAEEVQAAIGRPALENLLRSSIPDLNIEPSALHVELLELPWTDVFTTNYDTLLERASAKVVTLRYEPVVNKEDIPYATKPRIVKLHGSFPSERPFIITEEDYRRYPIDYAPFVNTVQQALLENTFCLIGFSGDDPNFLQWIGWIRDNLGRDKTQKIYLVGVFNLSAARLQLLAHRGIIVVDLSSCDGINAHDHKKALSTFFEYIRSKKPDTLSWPTNPNSMHPEHSANSINEFQKIIQEWRQQRLAYPGWLILPHSNRESLWRFTSAWTNYLPDLEKSPPGLDILYTFELIWRLERCLLPLFNNIAEYCEVLIEKYWPFQTVHSPKNSLIHPGEEIFRSLPSYDIQQAWLAIALATLRFYREEGFLEKWKVAEARLKGLSDQLSSEQREFLHYEGYLFSLFTLDLAGARQRLENWRTNEAQPYWMAKRAAAFAEIGLLGEAESLIRDALENVRKKLNQKVGAVDLTLVSLESNAMLLAKYIQESAAFDKGAELSSANEKRALFSDRWNELKGFKCDPWNELKLFELTLKNSPIEKKAVTKKREFDIGRVTQSRQFAGSAPEGISAYAFLRFCEEVGMPFRVGNYTMATETALASMQRISKSSSFWAIATLARIGDTTGVDSLFGRESVCRLSVNEADQIIRSYLDVLNKCQDEIRAGDIVRNDNYGVRLAQLLPEVVSRLCCKCSEKVKHLVVEFITEVYASSEKANYRNIGHLLDRLLTSMSESERYNIVPDLLKIPYPGDLDDLSKTEFHNPFLLLDLEHKPKCVADLDIHTGVVDHLLRQSTLENLDRRRWATTTLISLYNLQLLDDYQSKSFANAIWNITDMQGLPEGTDFRKFAFLRLPHPESVNPLELFKEYVFSTGFPIQKHKKDKGVNLTGGRITIVHEVLGANSHDQSVWTEVDAVEFMARLSEWWNADKEQLNAKEVVYEGFPSIQSEFRARFTRLLELIAEVIGPRLSKETPEETKLSLSQVLAETRKYGLPSLAAESACLHIYEDLKDEVYSRINEALISSQDHIQRDGLRAVLKIVLGTSNITKKSDEYEPISMLGQYLTWCPTPSISSALAITARIIKESPDSFSRSLEVATLRRLDRLLADTTYNTNNVEIPFDEKLEVRHISSVLAATLWLRYKSGSESVPEVIERWRTACLSPKEFAEIRNPWIDADCESHALRTPDD